MSAPIGTNQTSVPIEDGALPKQTAKDEPTCWEATKNCMSFLFAFVLVILLLFPLCFVMSLVQTAIDYSGDARQLCEIALLFCSIWLMNIYCFFRDHYAELRRSMVSKIMPQFKKDVVAHDFCLRFVSTFAHCLYSHLFMLFVQEGIVSLVYGNIEDAKFRQAEDLSKELVETCCGVSAMLALQALILLISIIYTRFINPSRMSEVAAEPAVVQKRFSFAWMCARVYGDNLIDILFHFCYFCTAVRFVSLFPILSGWINEDFLASLSWTSSFCLLTLPPYAVFLVLCVVMESYIYCLHRGRNGNGNTVVGFENPNSIV